MKYWCYYTDVVRYLERVEKLCARKTKAPAYLVWQDDDGPSMIIGPGVEWYRGDGPPPGIDAIDLRIVLPRRTPPSRKSINRAATLGRAQPADPAPPPPNAGNATPQGRGASLRRALLSLRLSITPIPLAHLRSDR